MPTDPAAARVEFVSEAMLVGGLEESETERRMHPESCVDDNLSDGLDFRGDGSKSHELSSFVFPRAFVVNFNHKGAKGTKVSRIFAP